jgi:hypothetical protein
LILIWILIGELEALARKQGVITICQICKTYNNNIIINQKMVFLLSNFIFGNQAWLEIPLCSLYRQLLRLDFSSSNQYLNHESGKAAHEPLRGACVGQRLGLCPNQSPIHDRGFAPMWAPSTRLI